MQLSQSLQNTSVKKICENSINEFEEFIENVISFVNKKIKTKDEAVKSK